MLLLTAATCVCAAEYSNDSLSKDNHNVTSVKVNSSVKSINKINSDSKNISNNLNVENNKNQTLNNNTNLQKNNSKIISKQQLTQDTSKKEAGVMNIPLDKSRKIYFAMDHTSRKDKTICNNIISTLKKSGFNVVRYRIGPNAMYQNILYLYKNKIRNAVIFHLLNGVDPSNIREVAKNGNDKRGKAVRSRGNDVVLAWFYDSSDCVHTSGSCYKSVRGSETGKRLYNPKSYMDQNSIRYICTSSDRRRHKSTADYTGVKTAQEFIKLFNQKTVTQITKTSVNKNIVSLTGTVKGDSGNNVNGYVHIKDSNNRILQSYVKVINGKFSTSFNATNPGNQNIKVDFVANSYNKASSSNVKVNVAKNISISLSLNRNSLSDMRIDISVVDDKNRKAEVGRVVYVKDSLGTVRSVKTNSLGRATLNINPSKIRYIKVYSYGTDKKVLNIIKRNIN